MAAGHNRPHRCSCHRVVSILGFLAIFDEHLWIDEHLMGAQILHRCSPVTGRETLSKMLGLDSN